MEGLTLMNLLDVMSCAGFRGTWHRPLRSKQCIKSGEAKRFTEHLCRVTVKEVKWKKPRHGIIVGRTGAFTPHWNQWRIRLDGLQSVSYCLKKNCIIHE